MDLDYRSYEDFVKWWLPVYRKQVIEVKIENDSLALQEIYNNIDKNWNLQKYKYLIFKELGISYLTEEYKQVKKVENADSIIIESFFKHKEKKRNEDLFCNI